MGGEECSLSEIITAFCSFLPNLLTDFIMKVLLGYAEYVMSLGNKAFSCEICGNNHHFIWKTRHGKPTGINIYKICYSNSAIRSRDKNPF
jgi:hypothetical protein